MRIATIEVNGADCLALAAPDGKLYPLAAVLAKSGYADLVPANMLELVRGGNALLAEIRASLPGDLSLSGVDPVEPQSWRPPLPNPGKMMGVAINNSAIGVKAHKYFDNPAFFMKAPSALIGHNQPIRIKRHFGLTHAEPELAVVIGSRMQSVPEAEVLSHIFGYTITNDVTSVGLKDMDSIHLPFPRNGPAAPWRKSRDDNDGDIYLTYHLRSKCTDTFAPMGPWIVTADEIADPNSLAIDAWLGDKHVARDNTGNLSFSVKRVLAHLSSYVTLEPGDIVHMGTAVDPKDERLREGDFQKWPEPVRIEVERIGTLCNPVEIVGD